MVRPVSFISVNSAQLPGIAQNFWIFGAKFDAATQIWFISAVVQMVRGGFFLYCYKNERAIFFDERFLLNYQYSFLSNT